MPRENSFTDSEGRSLTPDLEDEEPIQRTGSPQPMQIPSSPTKSRGRPSHDIPSKLATSPDRLNSYPLSPITDTQQRRSIDAALGRHAMTPKDRFKGAVRKIMAIRHTSHLLSNKGVGAEPGIDPRRASAFLNYGHIKQNCTIEIADYSSVRSSFGKMENEDFVRFLADPGASRRESWVKVRWINVGGISWDVISALALKYDMHPLALEDILHRRGHARSKADYYHKHLFLRLLCHSLSHDEDYEPPSMTMSNVPRSSSPEPLLIDEEDEDSIDRAKLARESAEVDGVYTSAMARGAMGKVNRRGKSMGDVEAQRKDTAGSSELSAPDKKKRKNARNIQIIKELKKGERVNVQIAPISIFLFRDGTVITIHEDPKLDFTEPIKDRIRMRDTGLRTTADPSLLVQSLIDLVVDQAMEVVEEYHSRILSLEHNVLVKPTMKSVRRLHILSGDLILHKRTLEPIRRLIYGLRRYDVDRVVALEEKMDPDAKVEGYMSHKSKIYLADVHDHMEYILTSLDMFSGIAENLINYTFNMSSYEMNVVMRRLTLATITFLPPTLLAGYFGMNFDHMWSIHHLSDVLYWIIAIPVTLITVVLFTWGDLNNLMHYLSKRFLQKRVKKEVKKNYKKTM